jgi:hypothetical protein
MWKLAEIPELSSVLGTDVVAKEQAHLPSAERYPMAEPYRVIPQS